jgi:hypothetical protein
MNMQDKDFDQLFRSKLDGLEVQPATKVWANIEAEIGGKKKRSLAPIWSIAAAVLVLLGVGTWFLVNKPVKIKQNQVAQRVQPKRQIEMVKATQPKVTEQVLINTPVIGIKEAKQPVNQIAYLKHKASATNHTVAEQAKPAIKEAVTQVDSQPAQILAAVPNKTVVRPVVPDMALAVTTTIETPEVKPNATVAVTANEPEKRVKKRGIRSLGGLINAVIAKVDKREDKLIEFTESDEDQSNVTGVNLGIIKIKKEK